MKWKQAFFIGGLLAGSFLQAQGEEAWIVSQEFIKIGKRDLYETLAKKRIGLLNKKGFPVLALQDSEPSEYIYLIPLEDFGSLEEYFALEKNLDRIPNPEKIEEMLTSTYHFKVSSMQLYLPGSSYPAQNLMETPYLAYYVYSIAPGAEGDYEAYLEKKVENVKLNKSTLCFRTWKSALGSDLPKFIICLFAKTKEELEAALKQINFTEGVSNAVFRNQHQGKATLRKDMSTFTSNGQS